MLNTSDPTFLVHTSVALTTNAATALPANSYARYRLFQNRGTDTVYINAGGTAVSGAGIAIDAGANYELSCASGNMDQRAISALIKSGTGTLLISEGA